ncbi:hypothetical protein G6O69_35600 [Pseudenhygromyxa sp. WMMC2535]|uniref:hypothetical protein n=1 Tax=Pseudenhygromyxa sp. WMMC2535 TaxID=2712867 RepID=UPI001556F156|nr:hypothetical protein [Pseudenhygromyxa sp. WMMC2535]NVB43204.1 hypothetical protein [Pseudenhygromyxa sp. WMMC2535]
MTYPKLLCAISLGSAVAIIGGFMVMSEVRAGELHEAELPIAAQLDADTLERASTFAGEYQYVGGQKERDGIDAAIDLSMDAVSPMLRKLGRSRLEESNTVPKKLEFRVHGDELEASFDQDSLRASLDGTPKRTTSREGEKVKVSYKLRGGKIVEFIDGGQGDRRNTFKLSEDGSRLTMKVEILSGHLPVPVEYKLTYKRK